MKTEETEELLKGLLDTGRFVPGDLLQCRSKNDHQIHSGTLTIDGGVEDYRSTREELGEWREQNTKVPTQGVNMEG